MFLFSLQCLLYICIFWFLQYESRASVNQYQRNNDDHKQNIHKILILSTRSIIVSNLDFVPPSRGKKRYVYVWESEKLVENRARPSWVFFLRRVVFLAQSWLTWITVGIAEPTRTAWPTRRRRRLFVTKGEEISETSGSRFLIGQLRPSHARLGNYPGKRGRWAYSAEITNGPTDFEESLWFILSTQLPILLPSVISGKEQEARND